MSVDPLAPKHSYRSPYQYAGNDPINQRDINGGEGSGEGGGGGGDGKASDGTGASDRKGVDIVHGTKGDIETKRNKRGQIYANTEDGWERLEDTNDGPNGLTREQMKEVEDHWTKDRTSDNTEVIGTTTENKVVEKDSSKVVEKTQKDPVPGGSKEGEKSPVKETAKKYNQTVEDNKFGIEAAKKGATLGESVSQYSRDEVGKEITKDVKKHHPQKDLMKTERFKNLIKTEQILERMRKVFKNIGIVGDLVTIGERIAKMIQKGKVIIKEIVEGIGDALGSVIEGATGPFAIFTSLALDWVKETELYKSAVKAISNLIKSLLPKSQYIE